LARLHTAETVLVTAAPSGVGVVTLLLAKYLGAQVIGTHIGAEFAWLKNIQSNDCSRNLTN
jgi:NADPH:quinone reductase-like Zn-dependent oxidoreductase